MASRLIVILEAKAKDKGLGRWLTTNAKRADTLAESFSRVVKEGKEFAGLKFPTVPAGFRGGGGGGRRRGGGGGRGGAAGGAASKRRSEERELERARKATLRQAKARAREAKRSAKLTENLSDAQLEEIEVQRTINKQRRRRARFDARQRVERESFTGSARGRRQLGRRQRRERGAFEGGGRAERRGKARIEFAGNLARAGEEFEQFGSRLQDTTVDAVRVSFDAFKEYEKKVLEVSTLTDEISVEDIKKITQDAAMQFGGLPTDQVAAFYSVVSAGATNAADAQAQLTAANQLAVGGVASTDEAVLAISKSVANFGVSSSEAADSLFTAVKLGQVTVSEMAVALPKVAQTASAAGLSIDETNAALALLSKQSGSAKLGATNLENALRAVIAPTNKAKDTLAGLNKRLRKSGSAMRVDLGSGAIEAAGGLAGWIKTVEQAGATDEELKNIFGGEGFKAVRGLRESVGELDKSISGDFASKAGAAIEANSTIMNSASKRAEKLEAQWEILKITAGEALVPALTELATELSPLIKEFTAFAKENPDAIANMAKLALGTAAVSRGIGGLTSAFSMAQSTLGLFDSAAGALPGIASIGPKVGGVAKSVVGGMGRMAAALGPFGIAAVGLVALFAGAAISILDDMKEMEAEFERLDEMGKSTAAGGLGVSFVDEEGKSKDFKTVKAEERERLAADVAAKGNLFRDAQFIDPARDEKRLQFERAQSDLARFDRRFSEEAGVKAQQRTDIGLFSGAGGGVAEMVTLLREQKAATEVQTEAIKAQSDPPWGSPSMEAG